MTDIASNAHEFTVSELAFSLKRTVEDTYGRVRVRGELGRVTIAKSGHCYLDIKDDKAVINSIMWKGTVSRLLVAPEEGMEVVVEGKMSTYPGRSNYQLIIDRMEPAGVGALMALLEKRKKMLATEGLFDESEKQELPYLPQTIGVVTSPTGSVIRDILHRIEDRFPVQVHVWPVLVQGEKAAEQITAAINGFDALPEGGDIPRPDVLIVARGGGSLEDLWCFNEENVARAAAQCSIPLISAVGHETDWTLIDYVADYRAPTPTGAAEVAVPVRAELLATVEDLDIRARRGLTRTAQQKRLQLSGAKLPKLETVLSAPRQRLDLAAARLPSLSQMLSSPRQRLDVAAAGLPNSTQLLGLPKQRLSQISSRLVPDNLRRDIKRKGESVTRAADKLQSSALRGLAQRQDKLERSAGLLKAYSYQGVLDRGYALVIDSNGAVVREGSTLTSGAAVTLTFKENVRRSAVITDGAAKPKRAKKKASAKTGGKDTQSQPSLF